ncbi:MAG: hypothetical protein FJ009_21030 [Chloroflexi bacterium]|nr:hypothetical protein [Chloroflexota bacterium]
MTRLKSLDVAGHAHFVTTTIMGYKQVFLDDTYCGIVIQNLDHYRTVKNVALLGYVVMPEHLHAILLPRGTETVSVFMRDFKKYVSKQVLQKLAADGKHDLLESFVVPAGKSKKRSHQVWMDEFWDENIYSEWFFRQKLDYIHNNPAKRGLVKSPDEYRFSSFRNYFLEDESVIQIDRVEW